MKPQKAHVAKAIAGHKKARAAELARGHAMHARATSAAAAAAAARAAATVAPTSRTPPENGGTQQ